MKKIYTLFAFVLTVTASAQNINIPDANFKAKLLGNNSASFNTTGEHPYITADTNSDGEISIAEAAAVTGLKIYANSSATVIQSLEGLQYFTNLKRLWCSDHQITTMDLSMMPQLEILKCENNGLNTLILPTSGSVASVSATGNNLTTFDTSAMPNITYIDVRGNAITTINLTSLSLLHWLDISLNPITTADFSNTTALSNLFASGTQLTTIDCSQTALDLVHCDNCPNLTTVNIRNNKLSFGDPDMLYYPMKFDNSPMLTSICVDNREQYNLLYTNYNSGGNAVVYTGPNCDVVVNMNAGIADHTLDTVQLYHNPAVNSLTIESDNSTLNSVEIINSLGQHLQSHILSEGQNRVDVSGLASGTYYLKVISDSGTSTGKFIKM